ncbi:MAG: tetratricopeptide repeat protein [Kiritimatiellae bacterium]|nr:tetratricopeptide repeat protein [Kiritimatiellia bacterium]
MTLAYWDRPVRPAHLQAEMARAAKRAGVFGAIEAYAWNRGLWTHVSAGSMELLKARLAAGAPVIVLLRDDLLSRFAVVVGYDNRHRELLCHDGRRRATVYTYDDFKTLWRGGGFSLLMISPPDVEAWALSDTELFDRARYFAHRQHYELAIRDFEQVIRLRPEESPAYVRLGNIRRLMGEREEAERLYREALRRNPMNAAALNNLAYLLAESGTAIDESIERARQAALQEPTNPIVLDTLGYAYYQAGRHREAAETLERARGEARGYATQTQVEIALHLVRVHVANGDDHLARQVLADALRLDPGLDVPADLRYLQP